MNRVKHSTDCILKYLWLNYEIGIDRLEISTRYGKLVVPFNNIAKVALVPTELKGTFRCVIQLTHYRSNIKINPIHYREYIVHCTDRNILTTLILTPENALLFKKQLDSQLGNYNNRSD